jgi:hypothetical protein
MADGNEQARPRTVARAPEEFSLKANFTVWAKQFRNYIELLNVQNDQVYRTLLSFMNPECFTLIEALELDAAERADIFDQDVFRRLTTALKSREMRVDPDYLLKYRKQRDDESIEKYSEELIKLAEEVYPEDQNIRNNRQLIASFVGGIKNDELAIKLLQENFNTLTDAVQAAVQYFRALQTRRFIKTETDFRPVLEKVYRTTQQPKENQPEPALPPFNSPPSVPRQPGQFPNNQQQIAVGNATNAPINLVRSQQFPQMRQQANFAPHFSNHNHGNNMVQLPFMNQGPNGMAQWSNMTQMGQNSQQGNVQPFNEGQQSYKRNNLCHFCQKPGHFIAQCYARMRMEGQQARPRRFCDHCQKNGHTVDFCFVLHPHLRPRSDNRQNRQYNPKNEYRPS